MFDVYCTDCSRRYLLSASQVLGISNDADGIHVAYRCYQGHVGQLLTGRAAGQRSAA